MACTTPYDSFKFATEAFGRDIMEYGMRRSIIQNSIGMGEWPYEIGVTRTVFTLLDSAPTTDEETWDAVTISQGRVDQICSESWNDVEYGWKEESYGPEVFRLRSPVVCRHELPFGFAFAEFLAGFKRKMAMNSQLRLDNRLTKLYIDNSEKIVVVDVTTDATGLDFNEQAAVTPLPAAECELDMDRLDVLADKLISETDISEPDSKGFIMDLEGSTVFTLYGGALMMQKLAKNNTEGRADLRYANPELFLNKIGATRIIRNWRLVSNPNAPRYTHDGVGYVRVSKWTDLAGTKGTGQQINPSYRTAPYEAALLLHTEVLRREVMPPINRVGDKSWTPINYAGDWQWVTGAYKWDTDCVDPTDDKGRYFARFFHAPRPLKGKYVYGKWIIYKRCTDVEGCPCTSS